MQLEPRSNIDPTFLHSVHCDQVAITTWFQRFCIFTPKIREDEPFLIIFFKGVASTTNEIRFQCPRLLLSRNESHSPASGLLFLQKPLGILRRSLVSTFFFELFFLVNKKKTTFHRKTPQLPGFLNEKIWGMTFS